MGRSGRGGQIHAGLGAAALGATALGLACCGRSTLPTAAARAGGDGGFLAPPTLVTADWTPQGGVRLVGRAPPDATVRLQAPDGRALGVTADGAGVWTVEVAPAASPQLFALSAEVPGRTVRAEGALATAPPGASTAALVARAGAASAPAGTGSMTTTPVLEAVDFDRGGGLAAAGRAAPAATLKLVVDGVEVGAGRADAVGRFGLTGVGRPLSPGGHRVRIESTGGVVEAGVDTAADPSPTIAPFRTARAVDGWRVDWAPPGGGVQSFLLLDAAAPAGLRAAR